MLFSKNCLLYHAARYSTYVLRAVEFVFHMFTPCKTTYEESLSQMAVGIYEFFFNISFVDTNTCPFQPSTLTSLPLYQQV